MGNSSSQEQGAAAGHSSKNRVRSSSKAADPPRKSQDVERKTASADAPLSPKNSKDSYIPSKPVAVQSRAPQTSKNDIPQNSVPQDGVPSFSHNEFTHGESVPVASISSTPSGNPGPTPAPTTTNAAAAGQAAPIGGTTAVEKFKAAINKTETSSSASSIDSPPERPAPLRRKSTLLLQGEHEPEVDEDMEFHKLNLQPGAQQNATKPLSRAGSGDEIQLGEDNSYAETKFETLISWQQGGEKVYVTGSFTGWRRMIKLSKKDDGSFSVVLKLPAGTHRMRFVVDNELRCSDYLPSATDSMGNLVNYIEVGLDSDNDMSMEPLHRTSSNYEEQQRAMSVSEVQRDQTWAAEELQKQQFESAQAEGHPANDSSMINDEDEEALNGGGYVRFHEEPPVEPVYKFTSEIPPVFTDPEIMEQFVASDFVTPPQLPPHLESVILNSNSNEKDNNSILPIPNHVVLNHLATTSIKHNVLAVASISRYSRKYVTQILYAPL